MNTHDPVQSSGGAPPASDAQSHRPFDKTRKTLYWLSAMESWKKSVSLVKQRAAFPMLRALVRRERANAASPLEGFAAEQLERAIRIHTLLLIALSPILLWSLVSLVKGLAALIRFQTITTWLLYSTPLFIFLAAKMLVSYQSRRAIADELKRRPERHRDQNKEGSASA